MDIGEALDLLKSDYAVTRKGWDGGDNILNRKDLVPWLASQTDILALDWEIHTGE